MDNINFQINDEIKQEEYKEKQRDNNYVNHLRPSIEPKNNNLKVLENVDSNKNTRSRSIAYDPFKSYNQSQKIASDGIALNFDYLMSAIGLLRILLIASFVSIN